MNNTPRTRETALTKSVTTALAAAVLSVAFTTVTSTSVNAAAPHNSPTSSVSGPAEGLAKGPATGCVTKAEYKKVKTGMSQKKVHKIFGTKGTQVSNSQGVEGRAYKVCDSKRGGVGVVYGGGKVVSKAAQWR